MVSNPDMIRVLETASTAQAHVVHAGDWYMNHDHPHAGSGSFEIG